MKFKSILYIFVPLLSLFVMNGCGSSSSSDNQPNNRLSEEKEEVAVYIPSEEFQASKELSKATNFTLLSSNKLTQIIKEDAERDNVDGKWIIYDETPAGASMEIEYDDIKKSRVMKLNSNGLQNGFVLGYWTKYGSWNNKTDKIVQWSMNYDEEYYVYIRITTPRGYRYLYYTPRDHNYGMVRYDSPHYIHHGLGRNSTDGTWRTFTRDIEADLKEFDPDNSLTSIDGFFIRGSGRIDDVILLSENETTPPASPSLEESINTWLASEGLNEYENFTLTTSTDKTRSVVSFSHVVAATESEESHTETVVYILDTSDVNDIKELHRNIDDARDSHFSYTGASIVDGKYIVENVFYASPGGTSSTKYYYDYNTGEFFSSLYIPSTMSLIQCENGDYSMLYHGASEIPIYNITLVDMSNMGNIETQVLYNETKTDNNTKFSNVRACSISDDKRVVSLLDNNRNVIEEFNVDGTSINTVTDEMVRDAIHNLNLGYIESISPDKTRAIVTYLPAGYRVGVNLVILDTSDLNNIRKLNEIPQGYYTLLHDYLYKDNSYIMIFTSSNMGIYDYTTGAAIEYPDLLGDRIRVSRGLWYYDITETYAVFGFSTKENVNASTEYNVIGRVDYSDPSNVTVRELDLRNRDSFYSDEVSADKSKILIKDSSGNVIDEIPIS